MQVIDDFTSKARDLQESTPGVPADDIDYVAAKVQQAESCESKRALGSTASEQLQAPSCYSKPTLTLQRPPGGASPSGGRKPGQGGVADYK